MTNILIWGHTGNCSNAQLLSEGLGRQRNEGEIGQDPQRNTLQRHAAGGALRVVGG